MEKQKLKALVEGYLSTREMAEKLELSQTSVRYWLKRHGLKSKVKPYNKGGDLCKPKEFQKPWVCEKCGEDDPDRFYQRKQRCKTCHNRESTQRFRDLKKSFVDYKGGKCVKCGYKKCVASLEFHHVDPKTKDPKWSNMRHCSLEKVKAELDKCILVCRNCHGEIHYEIT